MIAEETEAVVALATETRGWEFAQGIRDGFATTPASPGWDWVKKARLACRFILDDSSGPRDMVKTLTENWGPTSGPRASDEFAAAAIAQMRGDLASAATARQERERAEVAERARQRAEAAKAGQPAERGAA